MILFGRSHIDARVIMAYGQTSSFDSISCGVATGYGELGPWPNDDSPFKLQQLAIGRRTSTGIWIDGEVVGPGIWGQYAVCNGKSPQCKSVVLFEAALDSVLRSDSRSSIRNHKTWPVIFKPSEGEEQ